MINPPWLDLHPSHLAQRRQTTLAKFFWHEERVIAAILRLGACAEAARLIYQPKKFYKKISALELYGETILVHCNTAAGFSRHSPNISAR